MLDLEADALLTAHDEQVELGALMRRPKVVRVLEDSLGTRAP